MKPESRLQHKIADRLNKLPGCWCFKVHGSAYQMAGVPDLVGCYQGRMFGLEVKMPGEEPTPIQQKVMRDLDHAGAIIAVVHSVDEALSAILDRKS